MFKSNSPRYSVAEEATTSVSVGPNGEYVFGAFNNSGKRIIAPQFTGADIALLSPTKNDLTSRSSIVGGEIRDMTTDHDSVSNSQL